MTHSGFLQYQHSRCSAGTVSSQTPQGLKLYSSSASWLHKSYTLSANAASFLQGALILPGKAQSSVTAATIMCCACMWCMCTAEHAGGFTEHAHSFAVLHNNFGITGKALSVKWKVTFCSPHCVLEKDAEVVPARRKIEGTHPWSSDDSFVGCAVATDNKYPGQSLISCAPVFVRLSICNARI